MQKQIFLGLSGLNIWVVYVVNVCV